MKQKRLKIVHEWVSNLLHIVPCPSFQDVYEGRPGQLNGGGVGGVPGGLVFHILGEWSSIGSWERRGPTCLWGATSWAHSGCHQAEPSSGQVATRWTSRPGFRTHTWMWGGSITSEIEDPRKEPCDSIGGQIDAVSNPLNSNNRRSLWPCTRCLLRPGRG